MVFVRQQLMRSMLTFGFCSWRPLSFPVFAVCLSLIFFEYPLVVGLSRLVVDDVVDDDVLTWTHRQISSS